jgi:GNAT superfamily N-acetyltransferase
MDSEDGIAEPAGFHGQFARWFESHGHRFTIIVAEAGERLVGTVWLERIERVPRPSELDPAALGYVTFTFVESPHRNRGVGAAMLERLRAVAVESACAVLIVWPSERSIPLYQRSGFASAPDLLEQRL